MHCCHHCGKILDELPFRCRRCGQIFCSDHHLPENHNCSPYHIHSHRPHYKHCWNCKSPLDLESYRCPHCGKVFCHNCRKAESHGCVASSQKSESLQQKPVQEKNWKTPFTMKNFHQIRNKIRDKITLKNFTIAAIVLVLVGSFLFYFPLREYQQFSVFSLGIYCFILAYFLYALKCWRAANHACAILMIVIPSVAYSLATTKIPESTNVLLYLFIVFWLIVIGSAILLYVSSYLKTILRRYIFKKSWLSDRYFHFRLSYSIMGVIVVSALMINYGGIPVFSENVGTVVQSFQGTTSDTVPAAEISPTAIITSSQILPTVSTTQQDFGKQIENTVINTPLDIDTPALEKRIHELINQQRKNNGLSLLQYDPNLVSIARKHSEDMAKNNFFSHYNLQGLGPTERGIKTGYSCRKDYGSHYTIGIAENIMQNNLYNSVTYYNGIPRYAWNSQEEIAQSTVNGWMNSPGHRENILTSSYDKEGIGVAIASDDKVYITEDFC